MKKQSGKLNKKNMKDNYQRKGVKSNSTEGNKFEHIARIYIQNLLRTDLSHPYKLNIGIYDSINKIHKFDLGNESLLVECKSHKWTKGDNVPSAKITIWNEAMYYFHLAPSTLRKIFFIQKDTRRKNNESLGEYYVRNFKHLIPNSVEIWEYDIDNKNHSILT